MVTKKSIRKLLKYSLFLGGALLALAGSPAAHGSLFALYNLETGGVPDSSGNANTGSVVGTTTYSTDVAPAISGRSTRSFSFDGSSHIELPQAEIDFGDRAQTTGVTISLWVKGGAQDESVFFNEGSSVDQSPRDPIYNLQSGDIGVSTDTQVRLAYRGDNQSSPPITIRTSSGSAFDNTWHHLVVTDNVGTVSLYIDGSFDSNLSYTPNGTGQFDRSALGAMLRFNALLHFTGLMDEVCFFDGILTTGEIGQLASGTAPATVAGASATNLIALYEFEDGPQDIGSPATLSGTGSSYLNDAPSAISSRSSESLNLTGDSGSDFLSLPTDFNGASLNTGATASLWVKTASGVDGDYAFSVSNSNNDTPFYGIQGDPGDNSRLRAFYRNDAGTAVNATGTAAVFGTGWHHLAMTHNGSTLSVYVDGSATPDITLALPAGALTVDNESLGAVDQPSPFGYLAGQFDEVAFYSRVLTTGEIGQLATGLDPAAIPDLSPPLQLSITGTDPNLTFMWNSDPGMYYNLRSSTDLTAPVSTWDLVVTEIPATAPANTLVIPMPADPSRFYVAEETTFSPVFTLWSGDPIPSNVTSIPFASGLVNYTLLDAADPYPNKFLHGAAIIHHDGLFHANWANSPVNENFPDEILVGRTFTDAANTGAWSIPETIGSDLPGLDRRSHAAYLEHEGQLWTFAARFGDGTPTGTRFDNLRAEAFILNETTDEWDSQGIVMTNCWPYEEPVLMSNGNYIVGGQTKDGGPVVAISHGNDLTQWDTVLIPFPPDLNSNFAETTVWANGIQVTAVIRGSTAVNVAWVATSFDGGVTWSESRRSNMPMPAAKAYAGVLSTGQRYLLSNLNNRDTLVVSTSKPGETTLSEMWRIRHGSSSPIPLFPGSAKSAQWSYPYGYEHDGKLYIVYSIGKENCGLTVIPIASLANP